MQEKNQSAVNTTQRIRKTIGKTSYDVALYFRESSTETAHDKLKRIIVNDYIYKKVVG